MERYQEVMTSELTEHDTRHKSLNDVKWLGWSSKVLDVYFIFIQWKIEYSNTTTLVNSVVSLQYYMRH